MASLMNKCSPLVQCRLPVGMLPVPVTVGRVRSSAATGAQKLQPNLFKRENRLSRRPMVVASSMAGSLGPYPGLLGAVAVSIW